MLLFEAQPSQQQSGEELVYKQCQNLRPERRNKTALCALNMGTEMVCTGRRHTYAGSCTG